MAALKISVPFIGRFVIIYNDRDNLYLPELTQLYKMDLCGKRIEFNVLYVMIPNALIYYFLIEF